MSSGARHYLLDLAGLAWRLALYFAILVVGFRLLSAGYGRAIGALGLHFPGGGGMKPAEAVGFGQARLLIAAIIAWLAAARLGRDRLGPMLAFRASAAAHLAQGMFWGFAAIAVTIGGIALLGGYRVSGVALSGAALLYYVPLWLGIAVINGLAENMAILGYPLFRCARTAGWTVAILFTGLLFAAAHLGNPGENPLGILSVFLTAVVMAFAVRLTGDLWLSVGIHAGVIVAEDLVFSVPDSGVLYTGHLLRSRLSGPAWLSGGDAGPEGSLLALLIFAILLLLLWLIYRKRPGPAGAAADAGS